MRKTPFIAVFLILAAIAFAIWALQEKDAPSGPIEQPAESETRSEKTDDEKDEVDPEIAELRKTLSEEEIENLDYHHKAALAANQNVVFYGKCVDQDGNPIPGVSVEARLTRMRKSMISELANEGFKYYENLQATSDEKGRFEFVGEGSYLLLESIKKDGYLSAKNLNKGYRFGQILYGKAMAGMHDPDPRNPMVFTMWKMGEGSEAMLTKRPEGGAGGPDVYMEKVSTGRPHYFNFRLGKKSTRPSSDTVSIVGENEGDAHWDPEKQKVVKSKNHYSWSFQMSIPGGGLQETEDSFLFRPPESGYSESYEFLVGDDSKKWTGDFFGKRFYLKTPDGNYGAFVLDVRTSAEGTLQFFFNKVYFNPIGERDLEYLQE